LGETFSEKKEIANGFRKKYDELLASCKTPMERITFYQEFMGYISELKVKYNGDFHKCIMFHVVAGSTIPKEHNVEDFFLDFPDEDSICRKIDYYIEFKNNK
jgi:hypothetical protein